MLDDSDIDDVVELGVLMPNSAPGCLLWIALLIVVAVLVARNREECAALHCPEGEPTLLNHECLCVQKARPHAGQ